MCRHRLFCLNAELMLLIGFPISLNWRVCSCNSFISSLSHKLYRKEIWQGEIGSEA